MKRKSLPSIILASSSPRRRQLLSQAGLKFRIIIPNADESRLRGESPRQLVGRLAKKKARSIVKKVPDRSIVIAADTVVVTPNGKSILEKPRNRAEASRMLKTLLGKTHTVLTGYSLTYINNGETRQKSRVIKTRVKMRSLSSQRIQNYIRTGEPMDKAGAYAAQGFGMAFIESVVGSYSNVVGLPLSQLLTDLEELVD